MYIIPGYEEYTKFTLIKKGWSSDKKYRIETADGRKLMLKISDISDYAKKRAEYDAVISISKLGINMMMPVDFGALLQPECVYMLFSWVYGEEIEISMPKLSEEKQYELGYESGVYLKRIHSIQAPAEQENWADRFNKKIDRNIKKYKECGISIQYDLKMINYINNHRYLLENRPQTIQHGDYHVGNLFYTDKGKLGVIDFNRWDYGDPWEEFNRIIWSAISSPVFASAQLDGYFQKVVPDDFLRLMAMYLYSNALASIPWAIPYGKTDVENMINNIDELAVHYNNFSTYVPNWYIKR